MDAPSNKVNNEEGRRLLSGGRLFGLIAVLCAVSIGIMIYVLATTGTKTEEFVPPPFESMAQTGTPNVPDGLGWQEMDAEAYKFSVCGAFTPQNGKADVWLTNPKENEVWMKLRILDADGNTLGETGLIRPGEYVKSVNISETPEDGDSVTLKIMAYEPDTYYSAGTVSLNTTVKGDAS